MKSAIVAASIMAAGWLAADWQEEMVQKFNVNYDESKIAPYVLPALLAGNDRRITTAADWFNLRRPEILNQLARGMYGRMAPLPDTTTYELLSQKEDALGGKAVRREVRIHFAMHNGRTHDVDVLVYYPKHADGPVPVFMGLNFKGNHAATPETDVRITGQQYRSKPDLSNDARASQTGRWQIEQLIDRNYATVTACYQDFFPDEPDGWERSIYQLFGDYAGKTGADETYTAIGAWSWGLSRLLDFAAAMPELDCHRVIVHGHSRLGKTSLWAGANDLRFYGVITNDSGCGGAALSKRRIGENVKAVTGQFPHWFVKSFAQYSDNEDKLPFDQHMLLALIAPRPLAVASATLDTWADPKGEFLSAVEASKVYALFGSPGLGITEMPAPDVFVTGDISYHIRSGKHDQTPQDWEHYLQIFDRCCQTK